METYVTEALRHGYIRPSMSPVSSSFFFVRKKEGGLRPCIDYPEVSIRSQWDLVIRYLSSLQRWNHSTERVSSQNWTSGARIIWCVFGEETSGKQRLVPHQATMSTSSCRMG